MELSPFACQIHLIVTLRKLTIASKESAGLNKSSIYCAATARKGLGSAEG